MSVRAESLALKLAARQFSGERRGGRARTLTEEGFLFFFPSLFLLFASLSAWLLLRSAAAGRRMALRHGAALQGDKARAL